MMQIAEIREPLVRTGDLPTTQFRIKESAKAFKILLSNLYSDRIAAIIRELSTNAYDSHVMNGNPDQPFDVHLPNAVRPEFEIRDYGVGLSPEQVENVYTVVFESDKTHSNDVVGCLGLGSKSPFSYVKNFNVESYYNGMRYAYMMYMDSNGIPNASLITNLEGEPTDEPNGVKITISVYPQDFSDFRSKAERIYSYFKTIPNISGQTINVVKPKYIYAGDGWQLREQTYYGSSNGARAIMGNVAYPIKLEASSLTDEERALLNINFDIEFPIGELDIEASREGLHYDGPTVRRIKEKLGDILNELRQQFEQKVVQAKNLWEARLKYREILETFPSAIQAALQVSGLTFNSQKIYDNGSLTVNLPTFKEVEVNWFFSSGGKVKKRTPVSIRPDNNFKIVIHDLKQGAYARADWHVRTNRTDEILLLKFDNDTVKQTYFDALGIDESDVIYSSQMPTKPYAPRAKRGHSTSVLIHQHGFYPSQSWINTAKDLSEGGFYVEVNRFKIIHKLGKNTRELEPKFITSIQNLLKKLGYDIPVVYGVKTALVKKLRKHGKWINFIDFARRHLQHYANILKPAQHEATQVAQQRRDSRYPVNDSVAYRIAKAAIDKNSPIVKYSNYKSALNTFKTHDNDAKELRYVAGFLGLKFDEPTAIRSLNTIVDEIAARYPLLPHLSMYNFSALEAEIIEYVNLLDGKCNEKV